VKDIRIFYADMSAAGFECLVEGREHTIVFLERTQDKILYGSDCTTCLTRPRLAGRANHRRHPPPRFQDKEIERKILYGTQRRCSGSDRIKAVLLAPSVTTTITGYDRWVSAVFSKVMISASLFSRGRGRITSDILAFFTGGLKPVNELRSAFRLTGDALIRSVNPPSCVRIYIALLAPATA